MRLALLALVACYISAFYNVWIHKSFSVDTLDRRYYYLTYIFLTDWVEIPPIYLSMMANFAVAIVVYTTFNISLKWRIVLVAYLSLFIVLFASKIGIVCLVALLEFLFQMIKQRTLAIISVLVLVGRCCDKRFHCSLSEGKICYIVEIRLLAGVRASLEQ